MIEKNSLSVWIYGNIEDAQFHQILEEMGAKRQWSCPRQTGHPSNLFCIILYSHGSHLKPLMGIRFLQRILPYHSIRDCSMESYIPQDPSCGQILLCPLLYRKGHYHLTTGFCEVEKGSHTSITIRRPLRGTRGSSLWAARRAPSWIRRLHLKS